MFNDLNRGHSDTHVFHAQQFKKKTTKIGISFAITTRSTELLIREREKNTKRQTDRQR